MHSVQTSRVARKFGLLIFRKKVAVLDLYPDFYHRGQVRDVRLYTVSFVGVPGDGASNGGASPYEPESLSNFYSTGPIFGREINRGDYRTEFDSVTGSTTITLLRTDGTFGDTVDEFLPVGISYDHFSGALPELKVRFGNQTQTGILPGESTFTEYRTALIGLGYKHAASFYDNDGTVAQHWTRLSAWALCYRKVFSYVEPSYTVADFTYTVAGAEPVPGKLISAHFPEDAALRFYSGWQNRRRITYAVAKAQTSVFAAVFDGFIMHRGELIVSGKYRDEWTWKQASNNKECIPSASGTTLHLTDHLGNPLPENELLIEGHTQHILTQQNFLEGTHFIAPLIGLDISTTYSRLVFFQQVFCRQNFEVSAKWIEAGGVLIGPDIDGPPFDFHLNETARLVEKYVEAGKPI